MNDNGPAKAGPVTPSVITRMRISSNARAEAAAPAAAPAAAAFARSSSIDRSRCRDHHDARDSPAIPPACLSGGGGGKLGVGVVRRVSLGLLAMGDIARAHGSQQVHSSAPPRTMLPCSRALDGGGGEAGTAPSRVARQRVASSWTNSCDGGDGDFTASGSRIGFVVAPQGGVGNGSGGRRRTMMRRRSRASITVVGSRPSSSSASAALFAMSTSTTMSSSPNNQQQLSDEQHQQQSPPEGAATAPAAVAASATATVASDGKGHTGVPAKRLAAAGSAATRPTRADGVSSAVAVGEERRLGVIRPAELGSSRAKKAKVKAMYARARDALRSTSASSSALAVDILEEALTLDPKDGHSWLLLARTRERMRDIDEATDVYNRAVVECPKNVHLWQSWGMLQDKYGDPATARVSFAKGLEADPGNPFVCHAWGLMEQRDGDIKRAREILESSKPRMAISKALAELLATQGNVEEARVVLKEALDRLAAAGSNRSKRGPAQQATRWTGPGRRAPPSAEDEEDEEFDGTAELLLTWASVEESRGDVDRALELMQQAMDSEPDNVMVQVGRARFEMRRGNMREARIILSDAANLPQSDGTLFSLWATLETREGNHETALKIAEAATGRFPRDKFLVQTMGTVHAKLGQYEAAIECFRRSIALVPAAPAYVGWALVVAKLAGRAQNDLSAKKGKAHDDTVEDTADVDHSAAMPYDEGGGSAIEGGTGGDEMDGTAIQDELPSGTDVPETGPSYEEARRLFELGILADPTHGPLYNAYGTMEAKIGNVQHARDVYRRGVAARCSGAASVWQGFGALEASIGNRDAAREIFARGIRESTEDVSFLCHSLGSLELAAQRPDEAFHVFVEGLERYPKSTQLLLGAALALTKMDEADRSRDYFRRAVEADPSHAHAWQAWGLMETRSGNFDVARSLWERGLKAVPTHGPLWQAYARMEEQVGEPEKARKLFAAGLERCPDHVHLHQAWAVMEGMMGELDRARELVLDGLRVDPYHGALWTVYAIIERQHGSATRSRKVLELGIRANPHHGPLYRSWAQMEYQLGNTAESRRRFEQGLEACPTYTRLYYAYADIEAAMGNTEFLEKLKERGQEALMGSGASPDQLQDFTQQMEAFESYARFDATSSSEGMESSLDSSSVDEFDFDW